jgi:hypothetical protein
MTESWWFILSVLVAFYIVGALYLRIKIAIDKKFNPQENYQVEGMGWILVLVWHFLFLGDICKLIGWGLCKIANIKS